MQIKIGVHIYVRGTPIIGPRSCMNIMTVEGGRYPVPVLHETFLSFTAMVTIQGSNVIKYLHVRNAGNQSWIVGWL